MNSRTFIINLTPEITTQEIIVNRMLYLYKSTITAVFAIGFLENLKASGTESESVTVFTAEGLIGGQAKDELLLALNYLNEILKVAPEGSQPTTLDKIMMSVYSVKEAKELENEPDKFANQLETASKFADKMKIAKQMVSLAASCLSELPIMKKLKYKQKNLNYIKAVKESLANFCKKDEQFLMLKAIKLLENAAEMLNIKMINISHNVDNADGVLDSLNQLTMAQYELSDANFMPRLKMLQSIKKEIQEEEEDGDINVERSLK